MQYIVRDNHSGAEWSADFKASDFHSCINGVATTWPPTIDQALQQIAIWNRAQAAHRQEFSYRLA